MTAALEPTTVATLAYTRVSTEDQAADDRTSLRDQDAAIAALAKKLSRTVGLRFTDAGKSGKNAEGRPGFLALLRYCEQHPRPPAAPGYVLVLNDSRWGRFIDPEEATYWRVAVKRWGWIVRFAEGDEVEDRTARSVMRTLHAVQATQYREHIQANSRRGMRGGSAQGFWTREAPLGYRREAWDTATQARRVLDLGQRKTDQERVRLVPGPAHEQNLVRWMFTRYLEPGSTTRGLVRELRTKAPGLRRWCPQVLRQMLRCRTFLGEVRWTPAHAPIDQRLTIPNAHPALISAHLFDQVQDKLTHQHRTCRRSVGYALSGLLTCALCGEPYVGGGGKAGPPEDPARYKFYRCRGLDDIQPRGRSCPGHGVIYKRILEPAVIDAMGVRLASREVQQALGRALDRRLGQGGGEDPARVIRQLEQQRERLVVAISGDVLTAQEAKPQLERIRQDLTRATAASQQRRFADRQTQTLTTEREQLLRLARDFPTIAARLHGPALQEVIRPWLAKGLVDIKLRCVTLALNVIPVLERPLRAPDSAAPKQPTITVVVQLPRKTA